MTQAKRLFLIVLAAAAAGPLIVAAFDAPRTLETVIHVLAYAAATGGAAAVAGWLLTCRLGMREGYWRLAVVLAGVSAGAGALGSVAVFVYNPSVIDLAWLIYAIWGAIPGALGGFLFVWIFHWVLDGFRRN